MIFFSRFSTNDLPHINHDIEMSISNALSSSNDGNWGSIDFENNPIVFLSLFLSHSHPHHFCFSVLLNHSIIRWKGHNLFFCSHLAPSARRAHFLCDIFSCSIDIWFGDTFPALMPYINLEINWKRHYNTNKYLRKPDIRIKCFFCFLLFVLVDLRRETKKEVPSEMTQINHFPCKNIVVCWFKINIVEIKKWIDHSAFLIYCVSNFIISFRCLVSGQCILNYSLLGILSLFLLLFIA